MRAISQTTTFQIQGEIREEPHPLHPGGKYYPYPEGSPPVMSGAIHGDTVAGEGESGNGGEGAGEWQSTETWIR